MWSCRDWYPEKFNSKCSGRSSEKFASFRMFLSHSLFPWGEHEDRVLVALPWGLYYRLLCLGPLISLGTLISLGLNKSEPDISDDCKELGYPWVSQVPLPRLWPRKDHVTSSMLECKPRAYKRYCPIEYRKD